MAQYLIDTIVLKCDEELSNRIRVMVNHLRSDKSKFIRGTIIDALDALETKMRLEGYTFNKELNKWVKS